jgi:hypothetical protein
MLLPFREHLDFGPTPYDQLQAKEGLPVIRGSVVRTNRGSLAEDRKQRRNKEHADGDKVAD